jgi:hypothetical protein
VITDQGNLFIWQSNDPSKFPGNSGGNPFGGGFKLGTADVIDDPAANLLRSDLVADARTVGACIRMRYFGSMMESAGEIGFVSNLPVSDCLTGGVGSNAFSVDELMNYCGNTRRFGTDTYENIYRLNEDSSSKFRGPDIKLLDVPGVTTGEVPTVVDESAKTLGPRFFGFVWRNTKADAGLTINFTKSVEWRAEAGSGLTQVPIHSYGRSKVPTVNHVLQKVHTTKSPIWEKTKSDATGAASRVAQAAFTGVTNAVTSKGISFLENAAMDILGAGLMIL